MSVHIWRTPDRLVRQLLLVQCATHIVAFLLAGIFAPRVLLLSPQSADASRWIILWMGAASATLSAGLTFFVLRSLRPLLKALSFEASSASDPEHVLALYDAPSRLSIATVGFAALVSLVTLVPGFRPPAIDMYTQVAVVLLVLTLVSTASLPAYVLMRAHVSRALELVSPHIAEESLRRLGRRVTGRLRKRYVASVALPVALVALGSSLLADAHARAYEKEARTKDAMEISRAAFEPLGLGEPHDTAGRAEVSKAAAALGYHVRAIPEQTTTEARSQGVDGGTEVTVPVASGAVVVKFGAPDLSAAFPAYLILALAAVALAAILGTRTAAFFDADVALATREIRRAGVADVMRGTLILHEARFKTVHGEGCGFNNTEWDMEFMDRLEKDPESLLDLTVAELAKRGGWEGAEVVMWLMMRGALSEQVEVTHKAYFLPSMTPIATMIFEEVSGGEPVEDPARTRERAWHDYEGADQLEGTYPFTIERSVKGFRINHFLHSLTDPKVRKAFKADEEATLAAADLSDEERDLIRRRDWIGMIHYGVIFFMLEKLGAVTGVPNPAIYAAFKGMSLDDFQKTRNAAITYGVAGKGIEPTPATMTRTGIGGWTYPDWRGGAFYPQGLVQKRELEYASRQLTAIEINGTAHSLQKPESFRKWREATPEGFVFAVKGSSYVTNRKMLASAGDSLAKFFGQGLEELGDRLGPILWQFMGTKRFDAEDVAAFLAMLPRELKGLPLRYAIEAGHESFACPEFVDMARAAGVAIVWLEREGLARIADRTADFAYLRCKNTQADEPTGYPAADLDRIAAMCRAWEAGRAPPDLPYAGDPAASEGKAGEVFAFMIAGAKERNPAAAMALADKLRE